jgi:hypothetical protein
MTSACCLHNFLSSYESHDLEMDIDRGREVQEEVESCLDQQEAGEDRFLFRATKSSVPIVLLQCLSRE